MATKINLQKIGFSFFMVSAAFLLFCFGAAVVKFQIFPYGLLNLAAEGFLHFFRGDPLLQKHPLPYPDRPAIYTTEQAYPGINMVVRVNKDKELSVKIMDLEGQNLHEWIIDWFEIWPDAEHVPEKRLPKSRPGTLIHGIAFMENGDIVFNFEGLGLVCMNLRGEVVWRLPYLTHHSVHLHDDGNLWVCGHRRYKEPHPRFPNRIPPFEENTILEVSPDGKILQEWSVQDILIKNNRTGLLYMGKSVPLYGDDHLHLNDVKPFPAKFEEGFFKRGDIIVSLRNINTVFVFNRYSEEIKFITTGEFVRQHDPEFIDGNRFSVYDNNFITTWPDDFEFQSRILIFSPPDNTVEVFFEGSRETPFYSGTLGKHQWLPNGNLLITDSWSGRGFEINQEKEIVWEYTNYVDDGYIRVITEVQRLPLQYKPIFSAVQEELDF